jgi:hypothetical protein
LTPENGKTYIHLSINRVDINGDPPMLEPPHPPPEQLFDWTDPKGQIWSIKLRVAQTGEHYALSELSIRPTSPGYALTQTIVRQMPILEWERTALVSQATHLTTAATAFHSAPHSGRPHSDQDLRLVADIYRVALNARLPARKAVAEALDLSHSTAAKRIMAARQKGFLPPAHKKESK